MTNDTRIKRLKYQSWYRGCKETDRILGRFARAHLDHFTPEELDLFEAILKEDDRDLFRWISGEAPMPEEYSDNPVMRRILAFDVAADCAESPA
ncbi:MAG: succinate dehydrogenase assembly factor 2 [Rickettsiales bacterium]|nr:succinate dehydrogenase assembly factor 2 [Rickettsiales bacterium]